MDTLYGFGSRPRYDVVIIGARCAGAALALLLARSGVKVLVVDRQTYGSDTLSTHALMRGAVLQLSRWGLVPEIIAAKTPPIRATTFHYGNDAVRVPIKPEHGVECLYAPRRTVLDRLLVDAAHNAGAEIRHGVILSDLQFGSAGRVAGVELKGAGGSNMTVRADLVVGADGRQSAVAQLVNARANFECVNASGIVFGYFENLPQDGSHWYFAKDAAAGAIPTNAGHCVFAAVPSPRFFATFRGDVARGFLRVLKAVSPELRANVDRGTMVGRLRGFAGAPGYLRQCHGAGWALVGDAGYFKDPLTAHGITDALRDADLLSRAIVDGGTHMLESYQRDRDALSRPLMHITDKIASFAWNLGEVRELHSDLSSVMKVETNRLASLPQVPLLAA
jgi:2-polyprenyl-6-methoxyphenol hydroxylase-like FAD-dependent oxidoreductase